MNLPAEPAPIVVESSDCSDALRQDVVNELQRREWETLSRDSRDTTIGVAIKRRLSRIPDRA